MRRLASADLVHSRRLVCDAAIASRSIIAGRLLRVPLFSGLKPLQLTELARHAERVAFRRGSTITEAGAPGDAAYLIVSGDAAAPARAERRPAADAG